MTIGIVTGFSLKDSAGLEQFLIGVLEGLQQVQQEGVEYVIYTGKNSDLDDVLVERRLTKFRVVKVGFGPLWKHLGLMFAPRADRYLFNGPLAPLLFMPHHSTVLVYDFAYRHERASNIRSRLRHWAMDLLTILSCKRASRVMAISEATKRETAAVCGIPESKISVVYPGYKDLSTWDTRAVDVPDRYFLFVGTAKARKNLLNLVRGYIEAVRTHGIAEHLLVAGRIDARSAYGYQIFATIREAQMEDRIRILGRIDDGELRYLYEHAVAFTFPSALEGFGMPVVEAMKLGTPVLTSSVSSLPEAAGDAALLVAPDDIRGMAAALSRLSRDPSLRSELVRKGHDNTKRFSWQLCAKGILAVVCDS